MDIYYVTLIRTLERGERNYRAKLFIVHADTETEALRVAYNDWNYRDSVIASLVEKQAANEPIVVWTHYLDFRKEEVEKKRHNPDWTFQNPEVTLADRRNG